MKTSLLPSLREYSRFPPAYWGLILYYIVTNGACFLLVFRSSVFREILGLADARVDLGGISFPAIDMFVVVFAVGESVCNLFVGRRLDGASNLLTWVVGSRVVAGLLVVVLSYKPSLSLSLPLVGLFALSWFVAVLVAYKTIRGIAVDTRQRESMLVGFAVSRHLGWMVCGFVGGQYLETLGGDLLWYGGVAIISASLLLPLLLPRGPFRWRVPSARTEVRW